MPVRRTALLLPLLVACSASNSDDKTHGPVVDASLDQIIDEPPDASPEASLDGGPKDAGHDGPRDVAAHDVSTPDGPTMEASSCTGSIALAGGTSTTAFGATSVNGGAWNVNTFATGSASSNPALVPFGGGFVALLTASTTNYLEYSAYASSAWSSLASASGAMCAAPAALGSAGLAAIGTTLHSVYLGTDNDFFHGTFTAGAWDCENDPLMPSGEPQSYGPSAPGVASVGSELIVAYDGGDHSLYAQSWMSGAWADSIAITGADVGEIPPTLIALTGGSSELLVVSEDDGDDTLYYATRASGTWSTSTLISSTDYTGSPVSLAPTSGGGAVLVYQGGDGNPYFMTFDPTAATPWSTPAKITTVTSSLTTPPTVAAGICGADAVAEVVQPTGIETFTLTSGTWSSPNTISTLPGMSFATIATSP
jgi:hypothetical protein